MPKASRARKPSLQLPEGWRVVVELSAFGWGYELYYKGQRKEREPGDGWDQKKAQLAGMSRVLEIAQHGRAGGEPVRQARLPRLAGDELVVAEALASNRRSDGVLLPLSPRDLAKRTQLGVGYVVEALQRMKRKRAAMVSGAGWTEADCTWALTAAGREVLKA